MSADNDGAFARAGLTRCELFRQRVKDENAIRERAGFGWGSGAKSKLKKKKSARGWPLLAADGRVKMSVEGVDRIGRSRSSVLE